MNLVMQVLTSGADPRQRDGALHMVSGFLLSFIAYVRLSIVEIMTNFKMLIFYWKCLS